MFKLTALYFNLRALQAAQYCANITFHYANIQPQAGHHMNTDKSTAEIATLKPAKKAGKSALEKLQAKYDKLDKACDQLQTDYSELSDRLDLELEKTRGLEAQLRIKSETDESSGYDTTRVANGILTAKLLVKMSAGKQDMPAEHLDLILDELTKDLTPAALQIQAH